MPFITQRDLALAQRAQAEKDYKSKLRAALLMPGLTAEQQRDIQIRLGQVGQPKVYDAKSPPPPGAIQLPKAESLPPPGLDLATLQGMKKAELQTLAENRGVPVQGSKSELIQRLLSAK